MKMKVLCLNMNTYTYLCMFTCTHLLHIHTMYIHKYMYVHDIYIHVHVRNSLHIAHNTSARDLMYCIYAPTNVYMKTYTSTCSCSSIKPSFSYKHQEVGGRLTAMLCKVASWMRFWDITPNSRFLRDMSSKP